MFHVSTKPDFAYMLNLSILYHISRVSRLNYKYLEIFQRDFEWQQLLCLSSLIYSTCSSHIFRHHNAKEDSFGGNVAETIVETKVVFTTHSCSISAHEQYTFNASVCCTCSNRRMLQTHHINIIAPAGYYRPLPVRLPTTSSLCQPRPSRRASPSPQQLWSAGFFCGWTAIWNWLPDSLRDPAISRDSFKRALKMFLFSAYSCT